MTLEKRIYCIEGVWNYGDPHAGVTRPDTHGTWEDVSTPSEV